jgi:hypothetical protein
VAADELARVDFQVELFAEIEASLFLRLSATVGQENIRARIFLLDSKFLFLSFRWQLLPLTGPVCPGERKDGITTQNTYTLTP